MTSKKLTTVLLTSMVLFSPCSLNTRQLYFLIFSVSLGVVSVAARPSSLLSPMFFPHLVPSSVSRKYPTSSQVSAPSKLPIVTSKGLSFFSATVLVCV